MYHLLRVPMPDLTQGQGRPFRCRFHFAMNATRLTNRWSLSVDRFGAAASFLCALHCAALPILLAALPALGLGVLADHRYEQGFVVFAALLAVASLLLGARRHQRMLAFAVLVPGIALLLAGARLAVEDVSHLHVVLVTLGGTLVAAAHVVNLRLSRQHAHDQGGCR